MLRRLGRVAGFTVLGGASVTTALVMVPQEILPERLLVARVTVEGVMRATRCAGVAAVVFLDYKVTLWNNDTQEAWDDVHWRSARRLVELAERNGGLYVKCGQGFATMNHLLPPPYWKTMVSLQNAVTPRPFSEVEAVLAMDLQKWRGTTTSEVLSNIDPTPIAAASLAQVHRGVLRATGEEVAVKVQYIDIQTRFDGDMRTIQLLLRLCGLAFPGYDFSKLVRQTRDVLEDELDFRIEAENAARAAVAFDNEFHGDVFVPATRLATPRVLMTTFVNGVKANDVKGMRGMNISPTWAAKKICDAFALQLFSTGFIHADPHAGNILVTRDGAGGKPRVAVLDHGLYIELTPPRRRELARLWAASTTTDTPSLEKVCGELGVRDAKLLASVFLQHPYDVFSPFKHRATAVDVAMVRGHAKTQMNDVTQMIEALPREYALVLRNISTVRAINKELGHPVRRTVRMLTYALSAEAEGVEGGRGGAVWKYVVYLWKVGKVYRNEWLHDATQALIRWWKPEVAELMDEVALMG